jgi:hypothetical protein
MAKKDKKKKDAKGSGAADAVEAVRSAVERTFQATTEGAAGTQRRTRELVDEVAHAAARIRETLEDIRLLDELKGLRGELDALARRVAALEDGGAKPAARRRTATRAKASTTKSTGTTRAKSSGTGTTRAKPAGTTRSRSTRSSS